MILRIANTPRDYAWGSTSAIAELLGTDASGAPEAELWLGDHPGSPARILGRDTGERDLAEWTAAHLPAGRLPFLLKVLAAAEPLSLQAHPSLDQARAGYARENAAGIPLDAPERTYKDDLHKPELIYALSDPFIALSGFRPVAQARAELDAVTDARLTPLRDRLIDDASLPDVVAWLLEGGSEVTAVIAALTGAAAAHEGHDTDTAMWATVRRLAAHYPSDPGVAISTLMHTVTLRPGEALYLPSGNLHSYQEGLGIEVMAASDNVLRGGLTPKHVDVPELLGVLDARPLPEPRLEPELVDEGWSVFRPDVPDFALTVVEGAALAEGAVVGSEGPSVLLCLDGQVSIDGRLSLARGESAFVDRGPYELSGQGRVVIASGND